MLKVSCPQQALLESVGIVSRGVSGRSTQPVQNNVYLEAADGQLRLVATDLEYLSIEAMVEADVVDAGAATVQARFFAEVVEKLPADDVRISADDAGGFIITCGRSNYRTRGLPPGDFTMLPGLVDPIRFEVPQKDLARVLHRTVFATSRDETRPILTGALFRLSSGQLEIVATDTYRLALQTLPVEVDIPDSRSAIVSRRALAELSRIITAGSDEPVSIAISDNQVEFKAGPVTLCSRLIEGQFVNYGKVVPSSHQKRLTCKVKELAATLARAMPVAREDANRVVFRSENGSVRINASAQDVGEFEDFVSVQVEGEDAEIAFNARYVLDMLDAIDAEEIVMELSGPLNSGALKPVGDDSYLYVLMPMQIM